MHPLRILHIQSTFSPGGKELRAARLMNAFGPRATHSIVSGVPGELGAQAAVDASVALDFPLDAPPLTGKPSLARFEAIARFMRPYDLVLTYNWGAMDAVLARRMHARDCPPLVHHEDGFNEDEAGGLKRERGWYRRLAFPGAHRIVVPSELLEGIALKTWRQPRACVQRIPNGIAVSRFAAKPKANALPGFTRRGGEIVVGTIAGLRRVKNLPRLVAAFAPLKNARLVVVGEGPERAAIAAMAEARGVSAKVHMPGFVADPASYIGLFDIFALSSDSEQAPISVLEAMAAGLPVVAPAVGDIAAMVSPENRPFIVDPAGGAEPLYLALKALVADPALRARVGTANRARAAACFDERVMIGAYAHIYGEAAGRPEAFAGETFTGVVA